MPILPQARFVCPSCFEEINLGACDIVSGVTIDADTGKPKILKKAPWLHFTQFSLEALDGPFYNREQAHRQCPREECQYLLPHNIERVRSVSLSVVGDVYSGKSLYIASLIRQLKEWGNTASNAVKGGFVQIDCLTPDIERVFKQRYTAPLFYGNNKPVDQTAQAVRRNPGVPQPLVDHPLIYTIQVSSSRGPATPFNLLIYDTAGEDFSRVERLVQVARFSLNSSAFIFPADPFSMEQVYRNLPDRLRRMIPAYAQPENRHLTSELLSQMLASFRRENKTGDVSRLSDIPIAVMVSKADIFTQAVQPAYPYTYQGFAQSYQPAYRFGVDLDDLDKMHTEVSNLLAHYQQFTLLNMVGRLGNAKLFATSATGVPPDRPDHFPSVTPWRCLDPLLWIFYQLGLIRKL